MTKAEVQAFLTKADLDRLQSEIEAGTLQVVLAGSSPSVSIRGKEVPFFLILELLGTV